MRLSIARICGGVVLTAVAAGQVQAQAILVGDLRQVSGEVNLNLGSAEFEDVIVPDAFGESPFQAQIDSGEINSVVPPQALGSVFVDQQTNLDGQPFNFVAANGLATATADAIGPHAVALAAAESVLRIEFSINTPMDYEINGFIVANSGDTLRNSLSKGVPRILSGFRPSR
jgi:hypothetical protein